MLINNVASSITLTDAVTRGMSNTWNNQATVTIPKRVAALMEARLVDALITLMRHYGNTTYIQGHEISKCEYRIDGNWSNSCYSYLTQRDVLLPESVVFITPNGSEERVYTSNYAVDLADILSSNTVDLIRSVLQNDAHNRGISVDSELSNLKYAIGTLDQENARLKTELYSLNEKFEKLQSDPIGTLRQRMLSEV